MRNRRYDVVIVGGGFAGLTLALQLTQRLPSASIAVVDRRTRPAPEVSHTIGESVVEIASMYLRETLGLGDYMLEAQLPKFGLRYFMSVDENDDLGVRAEFGAFAPPDGPPFDGVPLPTYNLDRGRLENHLAALCREHGVELHDETIVTNVELDEPHLLTLKRGEEIAVVESAWVIDASGPTRVLGRHLDLLRQAEHSNTSAWLRIGVRIDPERWVEPDDHRAFVERTQPGLRWLSTNHLVGPGYWVWIIPLASGATSVGVTIAPGEYEVDEINKLERFRGWLRKHEPQLANEVDDHEDAIVDFGVRTFRAYSVSEIVSPKRWAVTGEAAAFLDPLYSPGADFIAICNTLIGKLVVDDLDPSEAAGLRTEAGVANLVFRNIFDRYLALYRGQYAALQSQQAAALKFTWDTAVYFGFNVFLFQNGKLCDGKFLRSVRRLVERLDQLQSRMQSLTRSLAMRASEPGIGRYIDQNEVSFIRKLYVRAARPLGSEDEIRRVLHENIGLLEAVADAAETRLGAGEEVSSRVVPGFDDVDVARDVTWLSIGSGEAQPDPRGWTFE